MKMLIFLSLIAAIQAVRIPPNPCPEVFSYYLHPNRSIFGQFELDNKGGGVYRTSINVSYMALIDSKTQPFSLELMTPTRDITAGRKLVYRLHFNRQDIIPRITRISSNDLVVCSGPPEEMTDAGVSDISIYKETRIFQRWVTGDEYKSRPINPAPLTDPTNCGVAESNGNYPWLVAIFKFHGVNYEFVCTGTAVSRRHVVTAAHCVRFFQASLLDADDLLVVHARPDLRRWIENAATRRVSRVAAHADYRQYTAHGDVAVLTLERPLDVEPICVWPDRDAAADGVVVGWGGEQNERRPELKTTETRIVPEGTCVRSSKELERIVSATTFCGAERNGTLCLEDSGSPFMVARRGRWYLKGIMSSALLNYNNWKCEQGNYVVFADVGKYASWIKSNIY